MSMTNELVKVFTRAVILYISTAIHPLANGPAIFCSANMGVSMFMSNVFDKHKNRSTELDQREYEYQDEEKHQFALPQLTENPPRLPF